MVKRHYVIKGVIPTIPVGLRGPLNPITVCVASSFKNHGITVKLSLSFNIASKI